MHNYCKSVITLWLWQIYSNFRYLLDLLEYTTLSKFISEQLGVDFAQFLLNLIENPPETDVDEQIPDLFLTLLLAYNLQFEVPADNLLLKALEEQDLAKTFCEKILLLLNREGTLSQVST